MSNSFGFTIHAVDRASSTLNGIGRNVNTNASRWSKLGGVVKRAGALMGVGLLIAVGAAVKFADAAAQDEIAAKQLALQLRNSAGATDAQVAAIENNITKMSLATGVADDELRPALGKLVTATGSLGEAQMLLALGMDVAAGTGKSLEQVTTALQKAQNGSVGGLSRLGVATKNAAGETKTFAAIQDDLAKKFKGASADAANSTAGQYARLKVQIAETGEAIGYKLIPYAVIIGNWMLNTGIPAAQKFGSWLQGKLGPAIGSVVEWFKGFRKSGGDADGIMKDLSSAAESGKRAWKALSPFLSDVASNILPALVQWMKLSAKAVNAFADVGIWMWNNVWSTVIHLLLDSWYGLSQVIGNSLKIMGKAPGMGWVGELGKKLLDTGEKARALGDKIKDIPDRKDVHVNLITHHINQGGKDPMLRTGKGFGADAEGRAEVAGGFAGWQQSMFSATGKDDQPLTLADMMAFSAGEQAKAQKAQADVAKLVAAGLSASLIKKLQAEGNTEALSALATATPEQIAMLNAQNVATAAAYGAAGMGAASEIYGAEGPGGLPGGLSHNGGKKNRPATREDVADGMREALEGSHVEFKMRGSELVGTLKAEKRARGGGGLGLD